MDISCNLTTDISHGFFRDISDNNKEKVKAKYCTKCNKLVSTSIFFFDELCTCPLKLDIFDECTGFAGYVDCSNIMESMDDMGPTGPTGPTGAVIYIGETGPTGHIGPIGQIGPTGATGPTGEIGLTGEIGEKGEMGPTGYTGDIGPIGPMGEMGPTGYTGDIGPIGSMGDMGPTGYTGEMGPTGPVGNTFITNGLMYQTFVTAYSMIEQELSIDEPVVFDTHSTIFGDCMHEDNTSKLWFWKAGNYLVSIQLSPTEMCQFSLVKNSNTIMPGGTMGTQSSLAQLTNTFLILLEDEDFTEEIPNSASKYGCYLEIVNTSSTTETVSLYGSDTTGNPIPQISASTTIMQLTP